MFNNRFLFIVLALVFTVGSLSAQKYYTRDGKITFHSDAPLEKIEAHNGKASSVIDLESGKMEFAVLIKAFQFEKALMQEHFNENYMESKKFPKATFKGKIEDVSKIDLAVDGIYQVTVSGDLTIHGVTQAVITEGQIKINAGQMEATATFPIAVADFDISIPAVVKDNIAKEVKIDVDINYQPLQ